MVPCLCTMDARAWRFPARPYTKVQFQVGPINLNLNNLPSLPIHKIYFLKTKNHSQPSLKNLPFVKDPFIRKHHSSKKLCLISYLSHLILSSNGLHRKCDQMFTRQIFTLLSPFSLPSSHSVHADCMAIVCMLGCALITN